NGDGTFSDLVDNAQDAGLLVHAYTHRDESGPSYETYLASGVDGVFTDNPDTGRAATDAFTPRLTETFDDGDLAGWGSPGTDPADLVAFGTDLSFSLPSIDGVAQIPITLSFDSSFRPYDNQTGEVLVSFNDGATFSTLLTLDTSTVPGGSSSLDRANEAVTLEILAPNSADNVQIAWRMSQADNDWWWAIDNIAVSSAEVTRSTIFAEDFEGLALDPFFSPSESGGDGTDFTTTPPAGWARDLGTTPAGVPEFEPWAFLDKNSWIATAGNQSRDTFTLGTGTIAVADGDEYTDAGDFDANEVSVFLETPEIDVSGFDPASLELNFNSSFRPYADQTGTVEVSFDGGTTFSTLLTLDTSTVPGGASALTRANEAVSLAMDAGDEDSVIVRFSYADADNDWWWAIDDIEITGANSTGTILLEEDFDDLPLQGVVDEPTPDPDVPVWTPTPPADWQVTIAETTGQGSTEFQGWTFMDQDFWIDTAGDQSRSTFTLASGNVAVADPDEWDDFNDGASGPDEFDSTISTPLIDITGVGGGQAAGTAAGVVNVPALSGDEGILVTPTGTSGTIDSYTIIFDVLVPETTQSFIALFQTDPANADDADIYLRNDGETASIGISGDYDGALNFGEWSRIALVFETDGDGVQTLTKYLGGVLLDTQQVDADVSDGSRWSIDADAGFLLFSEPNGFTAELFANAFAFTPEVLDESAIAALGGVDVDGPLDGSTDAGAFQLDFDGALDGLDFGTATVEPISLAGPDDTSYLVKGSIFGNPDGEGEAALYQQSNGADERLIWLDESAATWRDYTFDLVVEPADNDTVGAIFYYQDDQTFYQLTLNQQDDTRTLSRFVDGEETVLATETASYRHYAPQDLRIAVLDGEITITLDDELMFDGPVTDAEPLSGGSVGILSQGMDRVMFDNISVNPITLAARALTPEPEDRWAVDLDGNGTETVEVTAAASLSAAGIETFEWLIDGAVVATGETASLELPPGETVVTLRVTDVDGAVSEDQITLKVAANASILAADDFEDGDFDGWTIVDEGTENGPSDWQVVGGALVQASDIASPQQGTGSTAFSVEGDGPFILRDGTYALWDDPEAASWTDYVLEATITPNDDDGIGLLFRYVDADNYYKLEGDTETGLIMLTRHLEGRETILARGYYEYTPGEAQHWRIEAQDGVLTPYIDGKAVFGTVIDDRTLESGTVGLYGWASEDLTFDDVAVTSIEEALASLPEVTDDSYDTTEEVTLTVGAEAGVLANDSDPEGDALTVSLTTDVTDGTLALNADGSFEYTPDAGFFGTDSFEYEVTDGIGMVTGTATITVAEFQDFTLMPASRI
ncbi:MAG: Ig-like domain-containing protein, partial [Pseudomonadota bacterium]